MQKKSFPTPIAQILGKTAQKRGWSYKLRQHQIWNSWDSLVGPAMAKHAQPAKWWKKTLLIRVSNSTWLQELSYMKKNLLKKIQAALPNVKIEDIRFEIGKVSLPQQKSTTPSIKKNLTVDTENFIFEAADEIDDDELREIVARVMQRDFQNKQDK